MNISIPNSILSASVKERIDYFDDYRANHPNIKNLYMDLWGEIQDPGQHSILFVYGPTGVGKTTLYRKVLEDLYKKECYHMQQDAGIIPYIGLRAIASEDGIFNWKDFYIRTLEKLQEPLMFNKVLLNKSEEREYDAYHNDKTTKAYRKSTENALKNRKTRIFLIDEAQHIAKIGSGKKLLNQMDIIKSLAAETNTLIILFGTYGLQHFLNLSDQLSRRGKEFHFPRYQFENVEDFEVFKNVLWSFQNRLPIKEQPDLERHVEFFYERSLGCVGILKDWIGSTLGKALLNGKEKITIEDFNKTALTVNQCLTIAEEILNGEKQQEEKEESIQLLRAKVGISTKDSKGNKGKNKQNKKVGVRKPKRDKVGVEEFAQ